MFHDSSQYKRRTFFSVIGFNALFFSGYLILKFPLAFLLHRQGMSLAAAYSVTTTAAILFGLCSIVYMLLLRHFRNQKLALLLATFLCLAAVGLLHTGQLAWMLLGVTLYIVGGSLYFFNITLLVNKQFTAPEPRLVGNYLNHILLNIGALVGFSFFVVAMAYGHHPYWYSLLALCGSGLLFLGLYGWIRDEKTTLKQNGLLCLSLVFLGCLAWLLLREEALVRMVVGALFVVVTVVGLGFAYCKKAYGYLRLICLVLLFSLPYWIGNVVLYNQFFVFLHRNVAWVDGVTPTLIILLDPLTNIVFGSIWARFGTAKKPQRNLQLGLGLIITAFFLLWVSLDHDTAASKLSPIYPVLTIVIFAISQFLIQTTMNASVSSLIKQRRHQVYGLGILRSVRVFAAIVAFYLMRESAVSSHYASQVLQGDQVLYGGVALVAAISLGLSFIFQRPLFTRAEYR